MTTRLIRLPELQVITGLRRSRIAEQEAAGKFPKRVRVSDRAVAWRSDEIQRWIDSRPRANESPTDTVKGNEIGRTFTTTRRQ